MDAHGQESVAIGSEDAHPLDNPVWAALTGAHAHLAEVNGPAARYQGDVTPFSGLADPRDPQAWQALAELTDGRATTLPLENAGLVPADWEVRRRIDSVQMVGGQLVSTPAPEVVPLDGREVPEMLELVARTQPGPFLARTVELGSYLGIREGGALVAMAGERMHPPGWTELSAVCTDAGYRGRGLATRLVRALAVGIHQRGETAFLHAAVTNTNAIRLYESIGFTVRRQVAFVIIAPRAAP